MQSTHTREPGKATVKQAVGIVGELCADEEMIPVYPTSRLAATVRRALRS
jgi:hypothetical protein